MSGIFMAIIGIAWPSLRLGARGETACFWSAVVGFYLSSAGLVAAALLGTQRSTPIHGLAGGASPSNETIVNVMLSAGGAAVLLCCALLLWGLRGRSSPAAG